MKTTMAAQIAALQDMTLADLREKYHEVFREETRSRHKDFLWKRIAWRMQAVEEGDLSERAKRRAAELANDADIRIRVPSGAFDAGLPPGGRARSPLRWLPTATSGSPSPGPRSLASTRARHKDFLRKRIAWRLQANEEGDLSERAKRRAAEPCPT